MSDRNERTHVPVYHHGLHLLCDNKLDEAGNPTGGAVNLQLSRPDGLFGALMIYWQDGPCGSKNTPNGAFIEDVLGAARQRLEFFQTAADGKFQCQENARAIHHINLALNALAERTSRRASAGVEGTHEMTEGDGPTT